jgi:hypothetical protein
MGRILLVGRLAVRDLRHRRIEATLVLLAINGGNHDLDARARAARRGPRS